MTEAGGVPEVSRLSGVPKSTLDGYTRGGEMKFSNAERIASALAIRLEWLATGRGPMRSDEAGQELIVPAPPGLPGEATVTVARYDMRAAAGRRGPGGDGAILERMVFSEDWIRRVLRRNPKDLAIVEAWGDSMEPTIGNGDVLMIDVRPDGLINGRIYVLDVEGELLVKRIRRKINGNVVVLSDNDRYGPEELTPSEVEPLRIVGEVVWFGRVL